MNKRKLAILLIPASLIITGATVITMNSSVNTKKNITHVRSFDPLSKKDDPNTTSIQSTNEDGTVQTTRTITTPVDESAPKTTASQPTVQATEPTPVTLLDINSDAYSGQSINTPAFTPNSNWQWSITYTCQNSGNLNVQATLGGRQNDSFFNSWGVVVPDNGANDSFTSQVQETTTTRTFRITNTANCSWHLTATQL